MQVLASEYYNLLKNIQNNTIRTEAPISNAEYFLTIDLESRKIIFPSDSNGEINIDKGIISVERDHRAETIYFQTDRYYDGVDLRNTVCVVEYVNALGESRIYPVSLEDTTESGKIKFGWCVGNEATKAPGTIKFAVRFYTVSNDTSTPTFTYNLNTAPCEATILDGLDIEFNSADEMLENEDMFSKYGPNLVEDIYGRIQEASQKMTWIVLP